MNDAGPRETAERRVASSALLSPWEAHIMADWPEGDEHWKWVINAPEAEIMAWVTACHANGEAEETQGQG